MPRAGARRERTEPDILVRITDAVRDRLAKAPPPAGLEARAREAAGARRREGRRLLSALEAPGVRVIAECKRRSPPRGGCGSRSSPSSWRAYEAGGAAAVSVVTEPQFFAGQPGWVAADASATALPVLQKDFLLAPRQLFDAVLLGADAVLLIARALPGPYLGEMLGLAGELGLEALVEVHDARDLERVLALPAPVVGVNARDLGNLPCRPRGRGDARSPGPHGHVAVMESGIAGPDNVRGLAADGFRRFLIGEHLLRSANPRAALAELVACA